MSWRADASYRLMGVDEGDGFTTIRTQSCHGLAFTSVAMIKHSKPKRLREKEKCVHFTLQSLWWEVKVGTRNLGPQTKAERSEVSQAACSFARDDFCTGTCCQA